jgi:hypothetical protein
LNVNYSWPHLLCSLEYFEGAEEDSMLVLITERDYKTMEYKRMGKYKKVPCSTTKNSLKLQEETKL